MFEEKLRNLQETCERLEREGREAKDSLVESNEKWSLEKEAVRQYCLFEFCFISDVVRI